MKPSAQMESLRQPDPPRPGRVRLRALCAAVLGAYVLFLVYGCLVPLEFRAGLSAGEAWRQFSSWHFLTTPPPGREEPLTGPADLLANVLLYVPLSVLAMATMTGGRRGAARTGLTAAVVLVGEVALSVLLEFIQMWVPQRTPSAYDILAQLVGGLTGLALWLAVAGRLARWAQGLRHPAGGRAAALLWLYAIGLALYLVLPLDLSISATRLYHRYKAGEVVLVPLSDAVRLGPFKLAAAVAMMIPIGCLAGLAPRGTRRRAALAAFAFLGGVVLIRCFIQSVSSSTTDLLLGTLGLAAGMRLTWNARSPLPPGTTRPERPMARGVLLTACAVVWLGCIVWFKWQPFDFQPNPPDLSEELHTALAMPFTQQYIQPTPMSALRELTREGAIFLALGLLVRALWPRWTAADWLLGTAAMALLAAGLEGGQLFLPDRYADATTAAVNLAAGLAGFALYHPLKVSLAPAAPPGPPELP